MTARKKPYIPNPGYTQADWDAIDSPELTDDELANLRPAREALPPDLYEALTKRGPGQRGPQKTPTKILVSIRLDQDILDRFKAGGPGWQSRINEALRKASAG